MTGDEGWFADGLARPPGEREAWLARECGNPAQRERVRALWRAHARAERELAVPWVEREDAAEPGELRAGARIGNFRLVEKIGEGGCGEVWRAEQAEPVRRQVALKAIKPGMDTRETIARFEAERQALATMEHPGIAKVFEAGRTPAGRPYFAMERVDGQPITRYCDAAGLTLRARLALAAEVARAIAHAHAKGVVHRDIKPSNVLVGGEAGRPAAKVIDFGIAKALEGRLTDRTLTSAGDTFFGTPVYMSPEQADGRTAEVGVRSDVHALGALVYELAAGRPPFDPERLLARGLLETRRILCEEEPPRPSERLAALPAEERAAVAARRGTTPEALRRALRGDVDRIVLKALEKEPARRYATAAELADDIERHLTDRPVRAQPRRAGYLAGKWLRRHRTAAVAGGAVVLVAAAGIGASWRQARRAEAAEAARARLVERQGVSPVPELVTAAAVPVPRLEPASPEARARARALAAEMRTDFRVDSGWAQREDAMAELTEQALEALEAVGSEERGPEWARDRVWLSIRRAMAERRQARPTAVALGEAAVAAATALREAGDTSGEATGLRALALVLAYEPILTQRMYGPHPLEHRRTEALQRAEELTLPLVLAGRGAGLARAVLVEILLARGEWRRGEAAVETLRRGVALVDELPEEERAQPGWRWARARLLTGLARQAVPEESGRLLEEARQEAAAAQRLRPEAAEAERAWYWTDHELGQRAMRTGDAEAELRHRLEAERRAFALHRRDPSSDDDWYLLLVARRSLSDTLVEQGRIGEAAAVLHRTAVDGGHPATQKAAAEGGSRRYIKGTLERIALLEAARGNYRMAELADEAQRSYVAALKVGPDGSLRAALSRDAVAAARIRTTLLLLRGDNEAAVGLGEATLGQLRVLLTGPESREADRVAYRGEVEEVTTVTAEALIHLGRPAEAEARLKAAAELRPNNVPPYTHAQRTWLALALKRLGREDEARRVLAPALQALRGAETGRTIRAAYRELLARAVFLEAVLQPDTEAGRARRKALLEEVARRMEAMTAEVRELYAQRVLMRLRATEK